MTPVIFTFTSVSLLSSGHVPEAKVGIIIVFTNQIADTSHMTEKKKEEEKKILKGVIGQVGTTDHNYSGRHTQ